MSVLSSLFEEDVAMQDSLEELQDLADDSEDIMVQAMELRTSVGDGKPHLFRNEEDNVNEDGLTPEEVSQLNASLLDDDDEL